MKISHKEKRKIILPLLEQLPKRYEPLLKKEVVSGEELITQGIVKDSNKRFIIRQRQYVQQVIGGGIEINHERRLSRIIDSASSPQAMKTALTDYLLKYGHEAKETQIQPTIIPQ